MSIEIHFDIACDDPATLVEITNELPQAEIEFHSGMGGLETVGTIVLPGLVLALQAAAWIREWRKKEGLPFTVVEVHVYRGDGERFDDGAPDAPESELSRRIRALANETPAAPSRGAPLPKKVRILFLAANATGTALDLEWEFGRIDENLRLAPRRRRLKLKPVWAVTVDRLIRALLAEAPTIVHFSGHGSAGEGILLRDEAGLPWTVPADALAGLFELFSDTVRCVVLNACYSEGQARAIRRCIPHVVGLRSQVEDLAAIAFSTGFYQAIAAAKDVPFAFELGKRRVRLEGYSDTLLPILL